MGSDNASCQKTKVNLKHLIAILSQRCIARQNSSFTHDVVSSWGLSEMQPLSPSAMSARVAQTPGSNASIDEDTQVSRVALPQFRAGAVATSIQENRSKQNHNTGARRRTRRASFQLDEQDEYELSQVVTLGKHVVLLAADDEPWPQVMS